MLNLEICPLKFSDINKVAEIEKKCFSFSALSEKSLKDSLENELYYFICAKNGSEILGYAGMYSIHPEGYILNIAVDEKFRGHKIGSKMVLNLLNHAKNLGLEFLSLEVRKSNIAAINLYKKFGFKGIAVRKDFYDKPKEDAVIMTNYFR